MGQAHLDQAMQEHAQAWDIFSEGAHTAPAQPVPRSITLTVKIFIFLLKQEFIFPVPQPTPTAPYPATGRPPGTCLSPTPPPFNNYKHQSLFTSIISNISLILIIKLTILYIYAPPAPLTIIFL